MAKILAILCSSRRGGNSEILLNSFLSGAGSKGSRTKKILLNSLHFTPCRDCSRCYKYPFKCAFIDDTRLIARDMDDADLIVIASPIFFGSIPGQVKMMIDKFQPFWLRKKLFKTPPLTIKNRRGVFLCVSGSERRDFFDSARKIIKIFFSVLDIEYAGEIYCGGVDSKGQIKKRKGIAGKAARLGSGLIRSF